MTPDEERQWKWFTDNHLILGSNAYRRPDGWPEEVWTHFCRVPHTNLPVGRRDYGFSSPFDNRRWDCFYLPEILAEDKKAQIEKQLRTSKQARALRGGGKI